MTTATKITNEGIYIIHSNGSILFLAANEARELVAQLTHSLFDWHNLTGGKIDEKVELCKL